METPSSNWEGGAPISLTIEIAVSESDSCPGNEVTAAFTKVLSPDMARQLAWHLARFADRAQSIPFDPRGKARGEPLPDASGGSR